MATLENILISSVGIQNSLKKYNPLKSLAEYVWNGFDAQASKVEINITLNSLQNIESIIIKICKLIVSKQEGYLQCR